MKKISLILLAGAILTTGVATETNAHAAKWHSGMPSALKGKWKTRTIKRTIGSDTNRLLVTNKKMEFATMMGMPDQFENLKWSKNGKATYTVKARRFIDGFKRHHTMKIKKISKNRMYVVLDGKKFLSSRSNLFARI
ncbi:hypothetical protein [Lentilactobacillus sp. Marseille-Q4993]|uniref:hypothetical protein n=1 Tax=Lentilactobacillus sp. Marseille-Q4993 TaxID=3039492 RepID=UPI0024BC22B3|nr:hypothetical protein [Lentilactobacillus sp. Marseille-Q4993]